jgi:hypothetical protein
MNTVAGLGHEPHTFVVNSLIDRAVPTGRYEAIYFFMGNEIAFVGAGGDVCNFVDASIFR